MSISCILETLATPRFSRAALETSRFAVGNDQARERLGTYVKVVCYIAIWSQGLLPKMWFQNP